MEDLPIHGDNDRLGGIDHPFHVVFIYLPSPSGDGYNAPGVYSFNMGAGYTGDNPLDFPTRHHLRCIDGGTYGLHGGLDVDNHPSTQPLGGRHTDTDDLEATGFGPFTNDGTYFGGTDIKSYNKIIQSHLPTPPGSYKRFCCCESPVLQGKSLSLPGGSRPEPLGCILEGLR